MDKNKIRLEARKFLENFGENIKTKFSNACAKTGQYNVQMSYFKKGFQEVIVF